MPQQSPKTIYLSDYQQTDYQVDSIDLHFDLFESKTQVKSKLSIKKRFVTKNLQPLQLNGENLLLKSVAINGKQLSSNDYEVTDDLLIIPSVPDAFELAIETEINPKANTALEGLYLSSGNFCTQCEAQGFRKITYMLDRPDVMATYTTTIVADKARYPILLSNGNLRASGELESDSSRHWAKWEDPFVKPTYLFALVAGDLARLQDRFVTQSGREVILQIYVEAHNIDKCEYAMQSLKKAMRWDEEVYGREYDLDIYMIVAVDDFNMGAMENKGLNVFNSKYVLAKPETATDTDYEGIESVIAHEYFHNWSGNRVTCRDWFQLSLKEGFTVFRDEEFSADMTSRAVKRIDDVKILRTYQFREDASPMAHPVRPESYLEIDNFYTVTIYNKGAEVVRMLHHLLGAEKFRKGTDCYFERHDGEAVTTDDFVKALEDANQVDFSQFRLWYSQAGTPELEISRSYNETAKTCTLSIKQSCPSTRDQNEKKPFHIPLAIGLLDKQGEDIPLQLDGETSAVQGTRILELRTTKQEFTFQNVTEEPIPSVLRGFSAPVKIKIELSDDERCFLMKHDSDDFNRWDAGQQLAVKIMRQLLDDFHQNKPLAVPESFIQAYQEILTNDTLDKALVTQAITLPSESYLAEFMDLIDPIAIHKVREFMRETIAQRLSEVFLNIYQSLNDKEYRIDQASIKQRSLKNACLSYLMLLKNQNIITSCYQQFLNSNNMTDVMAALQPLANTDCPERETALAHFYQQWKNEPLVVDKWLNIQASSSLANTLEQVKRLTAHEAFNIKNPNKIRALISSFANLNQAQFHAVNGAAYEFLTDFILELDPLNSQVSSRLVSVYTHWRKYDLQRQSLLKQQLEKLANTPNLSKNVYEIVSKSLC